jgi:outer membrane protein assembly factor BamA
MLRALICISLLPVCVAASHAAPRPESSDQSSGNVTVARLQFQTPVRLTPSERQQLIEDLRRVGWKLGQEQTSEFTKSTAEELTREIYQDNGYFKAQAFAELIGVRAQRRTNAVAVIVRVDPGTQYRVASILWRGVMVFPEYQLEELIPLKAGELFNRAAIAKGLVAAKNLYSSQGYINFTSVPTPQVDEEARTVAFVIDVDEGRQFRFGELQVDGMQKEHRQILLSAWQGLQGRPYSAEYADKFFDRFFKSPLPNITAKDYTVRDVDERTHLVNYSLRLTATCATEKCDQ